MIIIVLLIIHDDNDYDDNKDDPCTWLLHQGRAMKHAAEEKQRLQKLMNCPINSSGLRDHQQHIPDARPLTLCLTSLPLPSQVHNKVESDRGVPLEYRAQVNGENNSTHLSPDPFLSTWPPRGHWVS